VQVELKRSPALEIPEWMFDSGVCSVMKQDSLAYVSGAALLSLGHILSSAVDPIESNAVRAQHLSSHSGGADVDDATIPSHSVRLFSSPVELPQLPPEAYQRMVRLLARMMNEHLQKVSRANALGEVGDE
jgi:hypothetical protein